MGKIWKTACFPNLPGLNRHVRVRWWKEKQGSAMLLNVTAQQEAHCFTSYFHSQVYSSNTHWVLRSMYHAMGNENDTWFLFSRSLQTGLNIKTTFKNKIQNNVQSFTRVRDFFFWVREFKSILIEKRICEAQTWANKWIISPEWDKAWEAIRSKWRRYVGRRIQRVYEELWLLQI